MQTTKLKYSLSRYVDAQSNVYNSALDELKRGNKTGHWMWFVFPQIRGLGSSPTSEYYGIQDCEEAKKYLSDPVLGKRLIECANALLSISGITAEKIFGYPDVLKLKSSMTLFDTISDGNSVFLQVLEKYYQGQRDDKTLKLLDQDRSNK